MNETPPREQQETSASADSNSAMSSGGSSGRVLAVVGASILLLALGAVYVARSVDRFDSSIEERNSAALERIEAFDQESGEFSNQDDGNQRTAANDSSSGDRAASSDSGDSAASGDRAASGDGASDDANSVFVTIEEPAPANPSPGELAFISRIPGADYKRLAVLDTNGDRRLLAQACDRFHIAADLLLCLSQQQSGLYEAEIVDMSAPDTPTLYSEIAALPSRARISDDQQWASWTVFVSGSGYQDVTGFSTIVRMYDIEAGNSAIDISLFSIVAESIEYQYPEPDFWGVSFGDDGDFFVTARFDGFIEVMRGSAQDSTMSPTGMRGSCPSLSPDRSTVIYKRQVIEYGEADRFQLVAHDLLTGEEWELGESRSVDDQVEWLDNDTIVYALHAPDQEETNLPQPEFDIWELDIAPGSEPRLVIPLADSPSVSQGY